jgi:murein DD-endopeptidase MepM/ murein hydrolase activator NlpD
LVVGGAWLLALSTVLLAAYAAYRNQIGSPLLASRQVQVLPASAAEDIPARQPATGGVFSGDGSSVVELPPLDSAAAGFSIARRSSLHTIIPTRPRSDVISYTVGTGDSVFGIAQKFNIKPETILWANYDQLEDSPDMLSPGMALRIPPVDGVYYEWQAGDSIEGVANKFKATAQDIMSWSGNHLDLTNPTFETGQMVLIPGGEREFVQWIVPTIPRGKAGVSKSVYGPGACEGGYDGAYGGGYFIWPIGNHALSGNDYWSGHLGIDIAAGVGDGVFASDAGVVVFSGWSTGGYGYMVMIDHGNGYQTVYGHLSVAAARCGQSVYGGDYIGAAGSTGNSTGPHLHFEIRYLGGFVNPWHMLPAP